MDIEVFEKCFSLILRFLQHCWRGNNMPSSGKFKVRVAKIIRDTRLSLMIPILKWMK
ncbi:hypothetical protein [Wolbachia endosymbiont (group B) of Tholera decimalis]|uniref:hypothetical protein n=1 Tax=Wolbachia endosymbiont (group B) of Tholera decimalis TaxID=3066181 RepID=UPI003341A0D7